MPTAALMAIVAAAIFPLGLIFLKKGYDHSSPLYGTIVVTAMNAAVLWLIALSISEVHLTFSSAALFFVIGGFIGHGMARYLQFIGLHHIGAARNTTVIAGAAAFLGVAIAVIFRGETLTAPIAIGVAALIAGVALLAHESRKTKWNPIYLLIPLGAALLYSIMSNLYKAGLDIIPDAFLAGAIGMTAALCAMLIFIVPEVRKNKLPRIPVIRKALPLFAIAGAINTIGIILNFQALKLGQVSIVHPILNSQPLFATLYGYLFLKQHEKITLHVVLGAVVVVAGIVVISAF
ncbi:DMT family transporter [Candidatus Woesearchaeota archaeon]|nr:DMT family transporter [Candidatus Woesearchaeota archaeon]